MTADSFWSFATAVYARAGMSAVCISLQDRLGADVNILLFGLWLARDGQAFEACADRALAMSCFWQNTAVAPLRSCRRGLRDATRAGISEADAAEVRKLGDIVKTAELAAEKAEIEALARLSHDRRGSGRGRDAQAIALVNLRSYFRKAGIDLDPLGETELLRIVALAFSG